MLVPDAAVVTDQSVKLLFTVAPDGTVVPKPVELGPVTDDNLRVISTGITADDQVIISGLLRARPGQKVTPEQGTIERSAPTPAQRRRPERLMNISHFFIDRPIFAAVISILITLVGGVAYFSLPVAQYPDIAPPSISVTASYPGASAEIVAKTVATPIEQEVNGVDNMLYMTSQSTSDGAMSLAVTFKLGTNLDTAQVLVQNRVAIALPRLPEEVRNIGVTVVKQSPDLMMVIHLSSPDDSRDLLYISNYATLHVKDVLARIDGVGNVTIFGARDYSMRIWLDPEKLAARDLTAGDVVTALRGQNVQVAAGVINQPPVPQPGAFQLNVETQGRLTDPAAFGNIIVKSEPDGRVVRIRDIGRVELGAADYNRNGYLDKRVAIPMGIFQRPGSNALQTAAAVQAAMAELSKSFPAGIKYDIVYNPTVFISQSVEAVIQTIFEAVILVVVVIILFLQTWRASVVPIVAIPVSLIGTFAVLAALGYSLNNLSLFGLVLAIGIVVDDAIVVVENVERNIREGLSPRDAAYRTMEEVGGALIAIALVLSAVFIPSVFLSGILGQFFRQFAVTIATATVISLIVSLTLEPGAVRAAVQAARSRASPEQHSGARDQGILQRLQPRLRVGLLALRRAHRAAGARHHRHAGDLCRADRLHRIPVPLGADRLHPAAGPRLSDQHHPAAARRLAGAHRRDRPQGHRHRAGHAGHCPRRAHRRAGRRHLHQRAECRRRVHAARSVQGARREGAERQRVDRHAEPEIRRDPGGAGHQRVAAAGARHRHDGRLQDGGAGHPWRRPGAARSRGAVDRRRGQSGPRADERVHHLQHAHAQGLCRYRPRPRRDAGRQHRRRVPDAGGLSRLAICQ